MMHHSPHTYTCGSSSLLPVTLRGRIFTSPAELVAVELSTQLSGQGGDAGPHHTSIQRHTCNQSRMLTFFFIHHCQVPPVAFQLSEQGSTRGNQKMTWKVGPRSGVNERSPAARRIDVTPGAVTVPCLSYNADKSHCSSQCKDKQRYDDFRAWRQ